MVVLIAAASENNALGKDNDLMWHLPNDFKRFKSITMGHHIIMGRKTFESFPKPLPNRTHIVITRKKDYQPDGCIVVNNYKEALKKVPANEDAFVIGGGEIYKLAIHTADKIELTRVHANFDNADTFFPVIDQSKWQLVQEEQRHKDENHQFDFTYLTYIRK